MMKRMSHKYSQTLLYVALLIVVVILMAFTRRCSNTDPLPMLVQGESTGDTIDVAIVYNPLSYYVYDDSLGGINFDLLRMMQADLHRPVKFWPVVSLHDALIRLEKGKYDMLASVPSDNSIKKRFLSTQSVFLDRLVLLQLADSDGNTRIRSALDLGEDSIYIPKDSPALSRLENLSKEIATKIPVVQTDYLSEEYLCIKVAKSEIPLAVVNEKTAVAMKESYPLLSYDNPVSFTQFQVWLLNRADTMLLKTTDRWLDSVKNTASYRSLIHRYTAN